MNSHFSDILIIFYSPQKTQGISFLKCWLLQNFEGGTGWERKLNFYMLKQGRYPYLRSKMTEV